MTSDYAQHHCLFSAPYTFVPGLEAKFNAVLRTTFREIWQKEQVPESQELTAWVVNPGQGFVIDSTILDRVPNVRLLVTPSTGRNHIDTDECERRQIAVYSLLDDRHRLNRISASAEFTFLLLLNTLRRLDFAADEVSAGRWRHHEDLLRGHELSGRHVGIVGLGRIGSRVSRYCRAFDAIPHYYDPYVDSQEAIRTTSLETVFDDCSAVCISCSLTEETSGMITGDLIGRLRHGASMVNTSRGEVVDEAGLLAVLSERSDLKVALDVLADEVQSRHLDSPLIELHRAGRVVITPHIAGASVESQEKAAMIALGLIEAHLGHNG